MDPQVLENRTLILRNCSRRILETTPPEADPPLSLVDPRHTLWADQYCLQQTRVPLSPSLIYQWKWDPSIPPSLTKLAEATVRATGATDPTRGLLTRTSPQQYQVSQHASNTHPYWSASPPRVANGPGWGPSKFTLEQRLTLLEALKTTNRPEAAQVKKLAAATHLSHHQIRVWFKNRRYKPLPSDVQFASTSTQVSQLNPVVHEKPKIRRNRITPQQFEILKGVWSRTKDPSPSEVTQLAEATGLTRPKVVKWFSNRRYPPKPRTT